MQALESRSGLDDGLLALALERAGRSSEARNVAERLLVATEDHIVARAIGASAAGEDAGELEIDDDAASTGGETAVAKAPPRPTSSGASGESSGQSVFERLVERGCGQVSSGQTDDGLKTLRRAFDIKPNDASVLVCLADGHAAQGGSGRARQFYDRALKQDPKNKRALRGAAKTAAKVGASEEALALYKRLLAVSPQDAAAKAYVAKHDKGGDAAAPPDPATPNDAPAGAAAETGG